MNGIGEAEREIRFLCIYFLNLYGNFEGRQSKWT